ncbi:thiamine pyrophosphate-dependent dehydrogenase E1 component subunit alpha [Sulfurimonas autotrophica]|uniref:Pyruvate dehydrogenase (Acetyl-transferring) n=1 Tax=Sulfurimonas autotrophica (strain ATCC BAA-671 / DSM 16294 / JCM 11897 / OK10) TaxID=563040 RepID=E0UP68_SULAO|nr:thiamine pyrophosphate-dependent enzyme [Sulfurimonas autotrophica]ADN08532.1 Pyruvate dehydrogenase (acetyl-transferring) [Sulfurimonas autotrophica DSM 16294]
MNKLVAEDMYYLMILGRAFEYGAKENYMKGNVSGFLHLDIGQEAFSVAAIKAFEKGDIFSGYREHIMAITRGIEPKAIMAELFGKSTGVSGGKGGSMHLFEPSRFFYGGDAIVGGQLPNAVGCAYARDLQGSEEGVMVIFGDGATNGGAFFESLNIAAAHKLPLLFVCENNQYAIATKITRVAPFKEQAKKAEPYMLTYSVDGMDAEAVYECVKKAKKQIEEGHGPIFIEAFTCRYEGHSVSDSNAYRSAQEMKHCKAKDPIEYFKNELKEKWLCTDKELEEIEAKVQKTIQEAVEYAENSPQPELRVLYENVFDEEA